jgi:hypothetical protein
MVSVGAPEELTIPTATTEESGAHHAHRFGFWINDEEARDASIPPEPRPLSRRGIRNWTIGSLVGSTLLAAVAAAAFSQGEARDERTLRVYTPPHAVPAQAAAARPAPPPRTIIALESLPIVKDGRHRTARAATKKTTHKVVAPARVTLAQEPSTTTVRKSSRALVPTPAKTTASAKTTTAANGKVASAR